MTTARRVLDQPGNFLAMCIIFDTQTAFERGRAAVSGILRLQRVANP